MPLTMEAIYIAVRDARGPGSRYWDSIAGAVGVDPDDPDLDHLVRSMRVSGYLIDDPDDQETLRIGTTPLPATAGGTVPVRLRPRAVTARPDDKLKVAPRMLLRDGEQPCGSAAISDSESGLACQVGVMTPAGPTVRIGVPILHEDRRNWRGGNHGHTVVLDVAGVEQLHHAVEEIIAAARAAAGPFAALSRQCYQTRDELVTLLAKKFGDPKVADDYLTAWWRQRREEQSQQRRLADMQPAVDALSPADRARYEQLEQDYQQRAGYHPDPEQRAAAARVRWDTRRQQAQIVTGLSLAHVCEYYTLENLVCPDSVQRARKNARLQQLEQRTTPQGRAYLYWAEIHHRGSESHHAKIAAVAGFQSRARPVTAAEAAEIDRVTRRHVELEDAYDSQAGSPIVTRVVAGGWGELVVQAVQGEDGDPHHFRVHVRPPGAGDDWQFPGEDWRPSTAQLRNLAATARRLHVSATPDGWRPPPAGVPFTWHQGRKPGPSGPGGSPVRPGGVSP